ncbi:YggS family pyridoxal phosphate-dependent enzyme [bacterium]|nr:YggS family pyridoxal phosphate-dependent enzyme [bacterium]
MIDVAENMAHLADGVATACARAGRSAAGVAVVAVTKRIPLPLVVDACRAGQVCLGENRIQDALPRQGELAELLRGAGVGDLRFAWHFIGNLQGNKVRKAVGRFELLHAVDSLRLAERISDVAAEGSLTQPVLLEVNVGAEPQKHGLNRREALDAAVAASGLPGLALRGFMCMARFGAPESELRRTFAALRGLADEAREASGLPLPELSMGMSDDFEAAIAEGSTMIRVGTAIFGPRETAR